MPNIENTFRYHFAIFCLIFFSIPIHAGDPADPQVSIYFTTVGGGFMFEDANLRYGLTFEVNDPFDEDVYLFLVFENPKKGADPLFVDQVLKAGESEFIVKSPWLPGITNNRFYTTVILIYGDKDKKKLMGKHKQALRFSMPEEFITNQGIELY